MTLTAGRTRGVGIRGAVVALLVAARVACATAAESLNRTPFSFIWRSTLWDSSWRSRITLPPASAVAVAADLADGAVEGHDQRARVQLQAEAAELFE